eukprot:gene11602-8270_t
MPVAWSDTSVASLNTVEDLTHTDAFQEALGFKSSDIEELLVRRFPAMGPEERAKHLASIRCTCIGYRRSSSQAEALYNPQGVWFYLKQLQDKGDRKVPRMNPNIVQPVRDEVVAFLVKQAAAPQALLSMAYYSGYLSFQYPKHELHGDVLVAPNKAMRDLFVTAVLNSLPGHYKTKAKELMRQDESFVDAVTRVYKAYVAATSAVK